MQSRLAIAAPVIAALTFISSAAGPEASPVEAAPVRIESVAETFVAPRPMPRPAIPADVTDVSLPGNEPIPYLFECDITRWTGDPSNATTSARRLEGVLGRDPVHFEADSYLIDDGTGPRGGSYACTLKIGDGPENPDANLSRKPLLVAASVAAGGHGHTIWKNDDGSSIGVAGVRMRREFLRRGHSMTWTWDGSIWQSESRRIEHAASCEGVTIVRGYDRSNESWCEHEEPWRRPMPAPPEDEAVHDGLPVDITVPDQPDVPVDVPVDLPSLPPLPVGDIAVKPNEIFGDVVGPLGTSPLG